MTKDRFRFRAWDKKNKRMLYNIQEAYDGGCVEDEKGNDVETCYVDCFSSFFPYDDNDKNEEFIVEQCTGLKDKNGRLIYEGDIVKRHSKYSEDEKDVVLQVEWNCKGARYITTDKKHDNWIFSMFDYEYEILGNIYEKPELLEDKK